MKRILIATALLHSVTYTININDALGNMYLFLNKGLYYKGEQQHSNKIEVAIIDIDPNPNFKELVGNISMAVRDPKVFAIILRIYNFGGSAGMYSYVHDHIKYASTKKPVIALITGAALSGGYLVASAANYIFSSSMGHIGSIGTLMEVHKYKNAKVRGELEADLDVKVISSGKYKTLMHPYTADLSEDSINSTQQELERSHELFKKIVLDNRQDKGLSLDKVEEWGEGQGVAPQVALNLNLIDYIGTLFDVESKIIELYINQRSKISKSGFKKENFEVEATFFNQSENKAGSSLKNNLNGEII